MVGGLSIDELRTPSIKKALSGETSYAKKTASNEDDSLQGSGVNADFGNQKIDNARLLKAWRVVADEFKAQPSIWGFMRNNTPKLLDPKNISAVASSETLQENLLKERNKILYFLKKELKNSSVELHFSLSELDNVVTLSDSDRVKLMMKKHPVFDRLRREFDLEIE